MARILALSSQVVSGHVGLSAIVPALQRLGHDVLPLPSVLLSNHPGHLPASGTPVAAEILQEILATLDANGHLERIDAILTGYLPTAAHVAVAKRAVARCRSNSATTLFLCDPVIGDDPKGIYIDQHAAIAIRDQLVPIADILTPNRFELQWLTGQQVDSPPAAITAAMTLKRPLVIATSIPCPGDRLANVVIMPGAADHIAVKRLTAAPNGTGDLLSALFLAAFLENHNQPFAALSRASTAIDALLAANIGHHELQIVRSQDVWTQAFRYPPTSNT